MFRIPPTRIVYLAVCGICLADITAWAAEIEVDESETQIQLETPQLAASIRKQGYVSGVYRGTFLDKQSGFRDSGFGLDIVDWLMEPGSDRGYRDQLEKELVYRFDNPHHGRQAKRSIEGPQIYSTALEGHRTICV